MRFTRWSMATLAAALVLGLAGASLTRADDAPATPAPAAATGTITGKVVDKDGNPVKAATVQAYSLKVGDTKPAPLAKSTTSGDDGTFKLEAVPAGKCIVRANTTDKLSGHTKEKDPVQVTADQETKLADPITVTAKKAHGGDTGKAAK